MIDNSQEVDLFVLCVNNEDYEVSLEKRKLYQVLPDEEASLHRMLRIIDESGEDYLYPQEFFVKLELAQETRQALMTAI